MSVDQFAAEGYDVSRRLGRGGTARVFLARRTADKRLFALKVPLSLEADELSLFTRLIGRENRLIGRKRYPGLVRIFGLDENSGPSPFLLMEYCPTQTLDRAIPVKSPGTLLNILSSISINLYYLHLAEIYHGDFKPQNIFLASDPGVYDTGRPVPSKISDFSLGLTGDENIEARLGVGTIGYNAPETIDARALDGRSDIFSLGIIAYLMASGKHPFMENDADPVRVNAMIKETDPEPLEAMPELSRLIMTMLQKDPARRPPNGYVLCEALEKIGADYPFRKVIRPRYILPIRNRLSNAARLNQAPFRFDPEACQRFLDGAGDDPRLLRHMLEVNFDRGIIGWKEGQLVCPARADRIIRPRRWRRWIGRSLSGLTSAEKKQAIRAAVIGRVAEAEAVGVLDSPGEEGRITQPMLVCLKERLSPATIGRVALGLARKVRRSGDHLPIAAALYLKAQNLDEGYSVTFDAITDLQNKNEYDQAFYLIDELAALCSAKDDKTGLARILLEKGHSEKAVGEVARAEKSYHDIIDLYSGLPDDRLLARVYKDLGDLYKMKQNYKKGIESLERARKIYADLHDELELSHTLNNIANIYTLEGHYGEALKSYRQALKIQRRLKAAADVALTLNNLAAVYYYGGNYGRTLKIFRLALQKHREIGNAREMARTLNNMAVLYNEIGDYAGALEALEESLTLNRRIGSKKEILFNLENLSTVMLSAGQLKSSFRHLREGLNLSRELSDKPHTAFFLTNMAMVQKRMGYYGQALKNIDRALAMHREISDVQHYLICLIELADLYIRLNDHEKAGQITADLLSRAEETNDIKARLSGLMLAGIIDGDRKRIGEAIQGAGEIRAGRINRMARLRLARVYLDKGEPAAAGDLLEALEEHFNGAHPDLESSGYHNRRGEYCLRIGRRDEAEGHYLRSVDLARRSALLPELTEALDSLGTMASEASEHEEAFRYYREAMKNLKTMAEDISDTDLRKKFLSDNRVGAMAAAVGELKKLLAKKDRQA